ncbi:sensor histidine kinase [Fluviispira vulneris]|uniref:sensor histidine kinase n=1 Tax=Fluviispira vulneris TaxID=2763012 RepID=UPI001644FE35|nr:HAMP domain-containing sensor histidine kinase [Fluviispira vulneris]
MNITKDLNWIVFAFMYILLPFLIIKYFDLSREITFGVFQIISEIAVILVLIYYRVYLFNFFSKKEFILFIVCFSSAIGADFLYMNNLTDFNKNNFIMAFIQEIFVEDFLFMVFMSTMLIFLFKRMKNIFFNNKISIIIAMISGLIYLLISIKFAIKSHFSPMISNPDYLQFYSCMIISLIESVKVGLIIAMSARTNKWSDFLFLQAILLLCFSELGISYTEIIVVDHLYGTSAFEAGWFVGILTICILIFKEKGMPKFKKEDFADNYSLRTIMSISILLGMTVFYCVLSYLKIIKLIEVEHVLEIILISFLVWFFANLVSMQFSKILVNISKNVIKLNHLPISIPKKNENIGTNLFIRPSYDGIYETQKIVNNYLKLSQEANEVFQKYTEQTKNLTFSKIANKVSHDIRSPLDVLSILVKHNLQELTEEKRIMIRKQIGRMRDIANDLLSKSREDLNNFDKINRIEQLNSILEEIISEKRLNFFHFKNLVIEGDIYEENNYGLFSKLNYSDLKRILSNLINNAFEALPNGEGRILVKLRTHTKDRIYITVEDNGKGIPLEVLNQIGVEGVSYNKKFGRGLGLFHALSTVREWGGLLLIHSEVDIGTKITLDLARAEEPIWFVAKITILNNQTIIIIDDEKNIHEVWDKRFKNLVLSEHRVKIIHFTNPASFREWAHLNFETLKDSLCFCDYEFYGFKESGLDLFEKYDMKKSIIVTSHYENEEIIQRCEKMGIGLIPKNLVHFVPLSIEK